MKNAKFIALALLFHGAAGWLSPVYARPGEAVAHQSVNQTVKATGTVVDETGEPMIGVTVVVKGTQTAAVTDLDG